MNQLGDEQFHQHILNSMQCAVVARDSNGSIIFWNRFAESVLGWDAAEILGKSIQVILPVDEDENKNLASLLMLPLDSPEARELSLRRKDGTVLAARVTSSRLRLAEGDASATVYVLLPGDDRAGREGDARKTDTDRLLESVAGSTGINHAVNPNSVDRGSPGTMLLRRVLDTLPIGVSIADREGQVVLSNPAEQKIWGNDARSPEQAGVQGDAVGDSELTPEDEALDRAIRNGDVTLNEVVEIDSLNQIHKTLLSSAAPIRNQQGQIIGGIAVHQDITEQRRIEEAERKQRTFVNALNNITAILTSSLNLQTVMERILDNVGRVVPHEAANIMLIEDDAVRVAFWRNYGPKCDEIFRVNRYSLEIPMLAQMLNTGLPQLISDTRTAPDWVMFEETSWIRSSVGVLIRAHDVILGFLVLDSSEPDFFKPPDAERLRAFAYQAAIAIENARLFSIVQEHATELELRVSERTAELQAAKDHVETILEHSSDGYALVTETGAITQVNPAFGQLFGISQVSDDSPTLLDLAHPDGRERLQEALQAAQVHEKAYCLDLACDRLDGSVFDADIAIARLFDAVHKTHLYICNVRDITRHKTAERELLTALEREKQLGELKSRFVTLVSHEFRTPLAKIQTSSDLLYRYSDRITMERRNEIILRIQSQIQRLIALLEDILVIAHADTFGLSLEVEIIDLKALCAEIITYVGDSIAPNRTIHFQSSDDPLLVELDAKLIRQVLVDLLSNALKFSPEQSRVDLLLHTTDAQIIIEVHDQGIGIPEDDLKGLFDPFSRANNVEERPGTGLGLAVVKRVVEAHHGTVTVDSKPGKATRFVIAIPKSQPIPVNMPAHQIVELPARSVRS